MCKRGLKYNLVFPMSHLPKIIASENNLKISSEKFLIFD